MLYQEIAAGVSMPMLGFGTFLNTGADCVRSVSEAIRAGYRLIDTAEAYGNEQAVGEGIRRSGIDRRELFLVTKVNFKSYAHTRETVENSLRFFGDGLSRSGAAALALRRLLRRVAGVGATACRGEASCNRCIKFRTGSSGGSHFASGDQARCESD